MNDAAEPTQQRKDEKADKGKSRVWLSSRWRDRILAACFWAAVVYLNSQLFHQHPPPEIIRPAFEAGERWWRWPLYFMFLLVIILRLGLWRSIWFAIYLGIFPLWAPILVIVNGAKALLGIIGLNLGFLRSVSSRRAGAAILLALPVLYFVLTETNNARVLAIGIVALLFISGRILFGVFRWVLRPLHSFTSAIEWILVNYNKGIKAETFNVDLSAGQSSPKAKEAQTAIDGARNVVNGLRWIRRKCITERSLLGVFLCVLLAALVLTVVNFGFVYYSLYKVHPSHLSGVSEQRGVGEFLYFSTNVMSTSDLSPIKPMSPLAKTVTLFELITALVLLSLLFVVFSTVGQVNLSEAAQAIDNLLNNQIQRLSEWEKTLSIPPVQTPRTESG